jgi:hypothetical protein
VEESLFVAGAGGRWKVKEHSMNITEHGEHKFKYFACYVAGLKAIVKKRG